MTKQLRIYKYTAILCWAIVVAAVLAGMATTAVAADDTTYWRTCQPPARSGIYGTVLTHRVGCVRARKVVWRMLVKSQTA